MAKLLDEIEIKKETCSNCKSRPAWINWSGNGGSLAMTHGWVTYWCQICSLEAQIEYKKEHPPTSLVTLEEQLIALKAGD